MSRDKKTTFTARKLEEVKKEAVGQTFLLVAAYLMDELDYDEKKILDLWDGITRYSEAIDKKLLTMGKVCYIIEKHTGLKVRWNG